MRGSRPLIVILGLAGVLAGCHGHTVIPSGAQEVHFTVVGSELRLAPTTALAGDIYVVVDTPGAVIYLVQRKATAAEEPGPMSDDDLVRLARGNTQGMSVTCCFETREPYGNIHKVVLSAGTYAFTIESPDQATVPLEMALLHVLP